jgi:hypothetical protein
MEADIAVLMEVEDIMPGVAVDVVIHFSGTTFSLAATGGVTTVLLLVVTMV